MPVKIPVFRSPKAALVPEIGFWPPPTYKFTYILSAIAVRAVDCMPDYPLPVHVIIYKSK